MTLINLFARPHCILFMAMVVMACVSSATAKKKQHTLDATFYDYSCPDMLPIVKSVVQEAMQRDSRMLASLLRLHFHDCFVNGCDGSLLLDDRPGFVGEKTAGPNLNSARGFDVIDDIKQQVEALCPATVSCADILAVAARDSVLLSGGPFWDVKLGRRDSLTASKSAANNDIPQPTFTVSQLTKSFKAVGLSEKDVVVLSAGHTIGKARCTSFQARLYNQSNKGHSSPSLKASYLAVLQAICPQNGDGNATTSLELRTPVKFDNNYYKNLQVNKGLLFSDASLQTTPGLTAQLVDVYAKNQNTLFSDFAESMIKLGAIRPLTGNQGEIRLNCRVPNT